MFTYLTKPYDGKELLEKIAQALALSAPAVAPPHAPMLSAQTLALSHCALSETACLTVCRQGRPAFVACVPTMAGMPLDAACGCSGADAAVPEPAASAAAPVAAAAPATEGTCDQRDCQDWCSETFAEKHCRNCKCAGCGFCTARRRV